MSEKVSEVGRSDEMAFSVSHIVCIGGGPLCEFGERDVTSFRWSEHSTQESHDFVPQVLRFLRSRASVQGQIQASNDG